MDGHYITFFVSQWDV